MEHVTTGHPQQHLIGLHLSERVRPVSRHGRPSCDAAVFSRLYDAWAALRNVEWMLPVTAGSDAHDVWYLGSVSTTFPGHDAAALRAALQAGRTRARVEWSWTAAKMPRHVHLQSRSAIRFLQGGHRGHS